MILLFIEIFDVSFCLDSFCNFCLIMFGFLKCMIFVVLDVICFISLVMLWCESKNVWCKIFSFVFLGSKFLIK